MRSNTITTLFFIAFIGFLASCASAPVDIKKENPKLFEEMIRDYFVASEENPGKVNSLKFIEDEKQTIVGKVDNFPIENCNWFFDRKISKDNSEEQVPLARTINLNCGGQYYIIDFDRKILHPSKLRYNGAYKKIFHQLKKGIILEASCSINSINENENDEKNTTIECYPYPFDLERYTKTQKREVVAGYFLYIDKQESLEALMGASKEEQDNYLAFETLKKNFSDEKSANKKEYNPSIGQNFSFKNCEFIDFRELPILNAKGKELKDKIDKLLDADLNDATNKEGLKDAIEEYKNCGTLCVSKEKEIQVLFEIRNAEAKRKILLIKKIDSKSELAQYKRFNFYPVDGNLKAIDFSVKGEIEKIYLNPVSLDAQKSETKKETAKETLIENDLDIKNSPSNQKKILEEEESSKSNKGKKNKKTEVIKLNQDPE